MLHSCRQSTGATTVYSHGLGYDPQATQEWKHKPKNLDVDQPGYGALDQEIGAFFSTLEKRIEPSAQAGMARGATAETGSVLQYRMTAFWPRGCITARSRPDSALRCELVQVHFQFHAHSPARTGSRYGAGRQSRMACSGSPETAPHTRVPAARASFSGRGLGSVLRLEHGTCPWSPAPQFRTNGMLGA